MRRADEKNSKLASQMIWWPRFCENSPLCFICSLLWFGELSCCEKAHVHGSFAVWLYLHELAIALWLMEKFSHVISVASESIKNFFIIGNGNGINRIFLIFIITHRSGRIFLVGNQQVRTRNILIFLSKKRVADFEDHLLSANKNCNPVRTQVKQWRKPSRGFISNSKFFWLGIWENESCMVPVAAGVWSLTFNAQSHVEATKFFSENGVKLEKRVEAESLGVRKREKRERKDEATAGYRALGVAGFGKASSVLSKFVPASFLPNKSLVDSHRPLLFPLSLRPCRG